MSKADDDMRDDYSDMLKDGVRGKYYKRLTKNGRIAIARVVILDTDVSEFFHDSRSVNRTLRKVIRDSQKTRIPAPKKAPVHKKASSAK